MKILLMLLLLTSVGCNFSNSISTNRIIASKKYRLGIENQSGELIVDTIYSRISVIKRGDELVFPIKESRYNDSTQYYLVQSDSSKLAIFDSRGEKVYGFVKSQSLYIDELSKTIILTFLKNNKIKKQIFDLNGQLILENEYDHIGYIDDTKLITLIMRNENNEVYHIFNLETKEMIGPFSHFNVYGESSPVPISMDEKDFSAYRRLNIITTQTTLPNGDYKWGVVDYNGNELLPNQYEHFRIIEKGMRERLIDPSEKPEGLNLVFYSKKSNDTKGNILFFDDEMKKFEYNNESKKILKSKE